MSKQGKLRLASYNISLTPLARTRLIRLVTNTVLNLSSSHSNIVEAGMYKFVFRRYASLYFIVGVEEECNELIVLEEIHLFVEVLDQVGGSNPSSWVGRGILFNRVFYRVFFLLCILTSKMSNPSLPPTPSLTLFTVLRQRLRTGHNLQLPQSLLHPLRALPRRSPLLHFQDRCLKGRAQRR